MKLYEAPFSLVVFIVTSLSALGVADVWAAPPIDVTKPEVESRARRQRVQPIRDEDLVFQDVNDPSPTQDRSLATVRTDLIGRGLPHRSGKAIARFMAFDKVKVIKESRDKRWVVVQAIRSGRKAWVPKSAVVLPRKAPPETAEESAASPSKE